MALLLLIPSVRGIFISALVGLVFLGSLFTWRKRKQLDWLLIIVSGFGLFILYLFSMLWSVNLSIGWAKLETKLALLVIPLSLNLIGPFDKQERSRLFLALLAGLVFSMVCNLSVSALEWTEETGNSVFFYSGLSKDFHPSYLAMYFCTGIAVLMFNSWNFLSETWQKLLKGIFLSLFSGFVMLLFSRTGIICLVALLVAYIVKSVSQKSYKELVYLPFMFLAMALAFCAAQGKDNRIISTISNQIDSSAESKETYRSSSESRIISWKSSLEIIAKNPVGVGIGDAQDELVMSFNRQGETYLVKKNLNSHNQFLSTGLAIGLLGIAMLFFLFILLGLRAFNHKDWLLASVLGILILNLMTESMLERADGTVFIPLILSVILFTRN